MIVSSRVGAVEVMRGRQIWGASESLEPTGFVDGFDMWNEKM